MTVVSEPPAALTPDAGPAIFESLTTRELDVLDALIRASWRTVAAVHPLVCPLWCDLRDTLMDLNLAWWYSFHRENPGIEVAP